MSQLLSLLLEENETRTDEAIQSEKQEQQQQCVKCDKTMKRIESDICIVDVSVVLVVFDLEVPHQG
jgi:hypothetical protein